MAHPTSLCSRWAPPLAGHKQRARGSLFVSPWAWPYRAPCPGTGRPVELKGWCLGPRLGRGHWTFREEAVGGGAGWQGGLSQQQRPAVSPLPPLLSGPQSGRPPAGRASSRAWGPSLLPAPSAPERLELLLGLAPPGVASSTEQPAPRLLPSGQGSLCFAPGCRAGSHPSRSGCGTLSAKRNISL